MNPLAKRVLENEIRRTWEKQSKAGKRRSFTDEQVRLIRKEHPGKTMKQLAAEHKVSIDAIFKVIHRRTYKELA